MRIFLTLDDKKEVIINVALRTLSSVQYKVFVWIESAFETVPGLHAFTGWEKEGRGGRKGRRNY